jgi:hypothetical protein
MGDSQAAYSKISIARDEARPGAFKSIDCGVFRRKTITGE